MQRNSASVNREVELLLRIFGLAIFLGHAESSPCNRVSKFNCGISGTDICYASLSEDHPFSLRFFKALYSAAKDDTQEHLNRLLEKARPIVYLIGRSVR